MSRRCRRVVALSFVALLVGSGVVAAQAAVAAGDRVLVVADAETGERYLTEPVGNGTVVALEYTHSVEKSRVYEAYAVRGDHLEQTRMEFESYGWGFPADANVTRENGTFVYDPDRNLTELTVVPGRIADHRLHVGNRTYDLVELSDAESVRIFLTNGPTDRATPRGGSNS